MFVSKVSICDRLKQRYGNVQQDWQTFLKTQENSTGEDVEFIQYIVNFIIEQAKHNIVLSELPEVIQTLHCETDAILRKNKMITLEELIGQVQMIGAMKYPYLRKLKPITTEDFVKEVIREVFERLGNIITLDMIENICQFTSCSAKQLLLAMPSIDVDEAVTLIIEDISRNQRDSNVSKKTRSLSNLPIKEMMNKQQSSRLTKNSHQSFSKTKLSEQDDISIGKNRSSKNINKNQINSYDDQLLDLQVSNLYMNIPRHQSTKEYSNEKNKNPSPTNLFSILKTKLINREKTHKIKFSKSKSNTQTSSIHSEEGLSIPRQQAAVISMSNMNDNAANSPPSTKKNFSSKDYSFMLEAIHNSNFKKNNGCQDSDVNNDEKQIVENDDEICPLEDIVNRRFSQQI